MNNNNNIKNYIGTYTFSITQNDLFWAQQAQIYVSWFSRWNAVQTGHIKRLVDKRTSSLQPD